MRQLKNCKKGHFVKYKGILCQVNCFFTGSRGKQVTLVEVKEEGPKHLIILNVTEQVEYLGDRVKDKNGNLWAIKRGPEIF